VTAPQSGAREATCGLSASAEKGYHPVWNSQNPDSIKADDAGERDPLQ